MIYSAAMQRPTATDSPGLQKRVSYFSPLIALASVFLLSVSQTPQFFFLATLSPRSAGSVDLAWSIFRISCLAGILVFLYLKKEAVRRETTTLLHFLKGKSNWDAIKPWARSLPVILAVASVLVFSNGAIYRSLRWEQTLGQALTTFVTPLFLITATWFFAILVFLGIGLGITRLIKSAEPSFESVFLAIWIGFTASIAYLQVWHLFFPINEITLLVLVATGITGLTLAYPKSILSEDSPSNGYWILLLVVIFLLANASLVPPYSDDSGLYDFSAIRWAKTYSIIPGLGNLHFRLAFNNSSHLFTALFDQGPLDQRAFQLVNNLLIFLLIAQSFWSLLGFRGGESKISNAYFAALLPVAIVWSQSRYITSPNPDSMLYPLGAVLLGILIRLLEKSEAEERTQRITLFAVILIAAAGVTVKLSFLILGFAAVCVAGLVYLSRHRSSGKFALAVCALGGTLLILPWMIRGIILSGFPIFPSTLGRIGFDFALPVEAAKSASHGTILWAHQFSEYDLPLSVLWNEPGWIVRWWEAMLADPFAFLLPLGIAIAAGLFAFRKRERVGQVAFALIPLAGGALYWLIVAPALAFEGAVFWSLAALAVAMATTRAKQPLRRASVLIIALISITTGLLLLVFPGPKPGFAPIPTPKGLREIRISEGLTVSKPADGLCWYAPLPCTPLVDRHLRLRKPGDLNRGFYIETEADQL
jgi:hypothetical protein